MTNYEAELSKVLDFVRPMDAEIRMLHMATNYEFVVDNTLAEVIIEKKFNYKVEVINHDRDILNTILQDIVIEAKIYKPSVITFFTHQSRSFLEKLILPSNAAEYSFYGRVPIIYFKNE
jgi:hypothetical protein